MYFYDIYPDFTACFIILIVPANLLGIPNLMMNTVQNLPPY